MIYQRKKYMNFYKGYGVFGFLLVIFGFAFVVGSFVSPMWLQSYSRIHTPFSNLGLWEFCLNGYVQRLDVSMQSYYGCWWIFSPELNPIRDVLTPWWFIIIQVLMSIVLTLYSLNVILVLIYLFDGFDKAKSHEIAARLIALFGIICGSLIFICLVVFGYKSLDNNWMPYPTLNWPSWSYGLAGLSGFFSFISSFYVGKQSYLDRKQHYGEVYTFPLVTNASMT